MIFGSEGASPATAIFKQDPVKAGTCNWSQNLTLHRGALPALAEKSKGQRLDTLERQRFHSGRNAATIVLQGFASRWRIGFLGDVFRPSAYRDQQSACH